VRPHAVELHAPMTWRGDLDDLVAARQPKHLRARTERGGVRP